MAALPATLADGERPGPLHCTTCEKGTPRAIRLRMHCGWLPREEWSADRKHLPVAFSDVPYTPDVCPGWLVRQGPIVEAAQAYAALESGILDRFDPRGIRVLTLAALELKRVLNIEMAERQRRALARMR